MTIERIEGFEEGFLDLVAEQLKRCRKELNDLDREIARLQDQRTDAAKRVSQLEDILNASDSAQNSISGDAGVQPSSIVRRPRPIADADAVVELIREHGEAIHYLDIHKKLVDRGFEIGGQGNPNTLLSRFFDDPRLIRIARGTYGLVGRFADSKPLDSTVDRSAEAHSGNSSIPRREATVHPPLKRPNHDGSTRKATVADQIAECLRQAGEPLHLQELTERLLSGGWKTNGKSPKEVVSAAVVNEGKFKGENSRFIRPSPGVIALNGWTM